MITLTVLGSGTVAPTPDRTSAAHWVEAGPTRILFDCGAGTLHRAASFDIPWHQVTHVALTHFHPDHWGELPAFLFALRWGIEPRRQDRLTLLGPAGLRDRLEALSAAFGEWIMAPEFDLEIVELEPGSAMPLAEDVLLECCKTPHTDESMAYAVRHAGRRLVYTGDTGESAKLAGWATDCDLLLCECSLPEDRAVPLHLTPRQAGTLAREGRVRRLVLTHMYPVFGTTDPVAVASQEFSGEITMARDGDRFTIEGP